MEGGPAGSQEGSGARGRGRRTDVLPRCLGGGRGVENGRAAFPDVLLARVEDVRHGIAGLWVGSHTSEIVQLQRCAPPGRVRLPNAINLSTWVRQCEHTDVLG
jgi:hypothetical protein